LALMVRHVVKLPVTVQINVDPPDNSFMIWLWTPFATKTSPERHVRPRWIPRTQSRVTFARALPRLL